MARLAVIGNLSLDRVDGAAVTPGGCPAFSGEALRALGTEGEILTRCASADLPVFEDTLAALGVPVTVLPSRETSAFRIDYDGDDRTINVDAVGDAWTPDEVRAVASSAGWIHVAPLFRSHFPAKTLAALAAEDCLLSLDGQGLVRSPVTGPLVLDDGYDPAVLRHVQALKLSEEEAAIVANGAFDEQVAVRLGVPEILLTYGSRGAEVFVDGGHQAIPAPWVVEGVQATGAGDVFMVGYAASRIAGADPLAAARKACELVARMLEARKTAAGEQGPG